VVASRLMLLNFGDRTRTGVSYMVWSLATYKGLLTKQKIKFTNSYVDSRWKWTFVPYTTNRKPSYI